MIEIIPAIMPKSFEDLCEKMAAVSGLVPLVQIDVMDGIFVPNKSWPYIQKPDPDFARILKEDDGFPLWQELDFEVDLMVKDVETVAQEWVTVGAKRLILHFESFETGVSGAETVDKVKSAVKKIKEMLPVRDSFLYTEIGIAINPSTPTEKIEELLNDVDFVQFMGIEKIGFQGQGFDERAISKISDFAATHTKATISVDGGVSLETAPKLIAAGINRMAIGSAIFASNDPQAEIENFFNLAAGGPDSIETPTDSSEV